MQKVNSCANDAQNTENKIGQNYKLLFEQILVSFG